VTAALQAADEDALLQAEVLEAPFEVCGFINCRPQPTPYGLA
jgi:hypothetical protein